RRLRNALREGRTGRDQVKRFRMARIGHEAAQRVRLPEQFLHVRRLRGIAVELQVAKREVRNAERLVVRLPCNAIFEQETRLLLNVLPPEEIAHERLVEAPLVALLEI